MPLYKTLAKTHFVKGILKAGQEKLCSTNYLKNMAWETRGNGRYFYRKERIGNKVKSVYIGSGELAELIAQCEKGRRIERHIDKHRRQVQIFDAEKLDEQIDEISELNRSLVEALFLLNGFHQHKRQWRKKRK